MAGLSPGNLFPVPPLIQFRPPVTHCASCGEPLKVKNTHRRTVSTLHVGRFRALEVTLHCQKCGATYRPEELATVVPPGANFGYDVMVYAGKATYLRQRNEEEVVTELAQRNIQISPREVSVLAKKFVVCLAIAHSRRSERIIEAMRLNGGYVCHLDGTCEGRDPILMSSLDSLSGIVLGNVKLPSEDEKKIIPFLERIKASFGIPKALVHDMGVGIIKAVGKVFPGVPDFICHFHFLRDIGKDLLTEQYEVIRKRLSKHQIRAKLRYRSKRFKALIDQHPDLTDALRGGLENQPLPASSLQNIPALNAYTLIQWALEGKNDGDGYGFPFDRPHLSFAKRLRRIHGDLEKLQLIQLRGERKDNEPYAKLALDLKHVMKDKALWSAVEQLERNIVVFERLRKAMRIAPRSGRRGLNDNGANANIRTIETRVNRFRDWLTSRKDYLKDEKAQKMIQQIDKYWKKLFADPITVQTPSGPIEIQPQRTNNILEQFFRFLKRAIRRRTGNASSRRILQAMFAETPLVRNLENPDYMAILLDGKQTLEQVFAEIEIDIVREEFRKAQLNPEKVPVKIKALIGMRDYPEKLVEMVAQQAKGHS